MNASLWISIVSITVSIMLFILYFKTMFLDKKARLVIIPEANGVYFSSNKKKEDNYQYDASYRLILSNVVLINESDHPITIVDFKLYSSDINEEYLWSNRYSIPSNSYTVHETRDSKGDLMKSGEIQMKDNTLTPILTIEPYGAAEGNIFFPFCPEITKDSVFGKLTIRTSRGDFEEDVSAVHSSRLQDNEA